MTFGALPKYAEMRRRRLRRISAYFGNDIGAGTIFYFKTNARGSCVLATGLATWYALSLVHFPYCLTEILVISEVTICVFGLIVYL